MRSSGGLPAEFRLVSRLVCGSSAGLRVAELAQTRPDFVRAGVVEVIEDDDHLGEFAHLYREVFQESTPEALSSHRGQRAEVDEVGVDLSQCAEKASAEPDRVVVARDYFEPDNLQFGVGLRPLGQQYRFPRASRSHDEGNAMLHDRVQFPSEFWTIDHVRRGERQREHSLGSILFSEPIKCDTNGMQPPS